MARRFWFANVLGITAVLAIVAVITFERPTRLERIPRSVTIGPEVSSAEAQLLYLRAKQETRRNYRREVWALLKRGHPLLAWSFVRARPGNVFELNKDVNGDIAAAVTNRWGVYRMEIPVEHNASWTNSSGVKSPFVQPVRTSDAPNSMNQTLTAVGGR